LRTLSSIRLLAKAIEASLAEMKSISKNFLALLFET
jgi:hypothetical protein